jgi:hypothetical protein
VGAGSSWEPNETMIGIFTRPLVGLNVPDELITAFSCNIFIIRYEVFMMNFLVMIGIEFN